MLMQDSKHNAYFVFMQKVDGIRKPMEKRATSCVLNHGKLSGHLGDPEQNRIQFAKESFSQTALFSFVPLGRLFDVLRGLGANRW